MAAVVGRTSQGHLCAPSSVWSSRRSIGFSRIARLWPGRIGRRRAAAGRAPACRGRGARRASCRPARHRSSRRVRAAIVQTADGRARPGSLSILQFQYAHERRPWTRSRRPGRSGRSKAATEGGVDDQGPAQPSPSPLGAFLAIWAAASRMLVERCRQVHLDGREKAGQIRRASLAEVLSAVPMPAHLIRSPCTRLTAPSSASSRLPRLPRRLLVHFSFSKLALLRRSASSGYLLFLTTAAMSHNTTSRPPRGSLSRGVLVRARSRHP